MPKISTDLPRHHLGGATMGTTWAVTLDAQMTEAALATLQTALQRAVDLVDHQMSNWNPASAIMRLNSAPCDVWLPQPPDLMQVLADGLAASAATHGAFEMNLHDAVRAWGFGPDAISLDKVRAASAAKRLPASALLDLDIAASTARKLGPLSLDLAGIAKGYGVDLLAKVLTQNGITHALCAIDGELRATGPQAGGTGWQISVETPSPADGDLGRASHSMVSLTEGALATSGDYRHFVTVRGKRLSHTIDPKRAAPLIDAPASVTVLSARCAWADAMATALMVMGGQDGPAFARAHNLNALFLLRQGDGLAPIGTGSFAQP